MVVIDKIILHPIKSAQGVSVPSATLGRTGFELDRAWAVVDVNGDRQAPMEAISQRKLAKMATIAVEIDAVEGVLRISAPAMPTLTVPLAEAAYGDGDNGTVVMEVQCSGVSTTDGGGWHLGQCPGYSAGDEAEQWFTEYLNR
jgi:uncharacterized protein YcbX